MWQSICGNQYVAINMWQSICGKGGTSTGETSPSALISVQNQYVTLNLGRGFMVYILGFRDHGFRDYGFRDYGFRV